MTTRSARAGRSHAGAVDVVVVGAGHSGLAMSHSLTARSIEHVVLERGEVANSWRRERWDSLHLLTPNWLTRLPGHEYSGDDPDGYMCMDEVVGFIAGYASAIAAPVRTSTTVTSVEPHADGYRVVTDDGTWQCRAVVAASGAFNSAVVPALSAAIPKDVVQLTPMQYRNPAQIEPGGVLVVGASATGLQLADEIQRAGHDVTISIGEHVRMPRVYRGRDIQWWLLACGILNERYDEVDDVNRVRNLASPQLVGSRQRKIVDLNALTADGARIVGRIAGVRDGEAQCSGSLRNVCALADLKLDRMLGTIDEWAERNPLAGDSGVSERYPATRLPEKPCLAVDLKKGGIRTIVWATGFRPDYSWLAAPALDRKGMIRHEGGVAALPGLYLLGAPFLRRRKSSFIHGAEDDVRDLATHIASYLGARTAGAESASRAPLRAGAHPPVARA
jgi:putative flavoprotein involved in K+ transport